MDNDIQPLNIPWPQRGDRAFATGSNHAVGAWPRWMPEQFRSSVIADGFKAAADYVVEVLELKQEHRYADNFFAPVAFMYRHFLEISMKSIVEQGRVLGLLTAEEELPTHNLHQLWNKARVVIEQMNPNADATPLLAVERVVLEFHEVDKTGQELRYAFTTDGKARIGKRA